MVAHKKNNSFKMVIGAVLMLSFGLWIGPANAAKKTPAEKARAQYEK